MATVSFILTVTTREAFLRSTSPTCIITSFKWRGTGLVALAWAVVRSYRQCAKAGPRPLAPRSQLGSRALAPELQPEPQLNWRSVLQHWCPTPRNRIVEHASANQKIRRVRGRTIKLVFKTLNSR